MFRYMYLTDTTVHRLIMRPFVGGKRWSEKIGIRDVSGEMATSRNGMNKTE